MSNFINFNLEPENFYIYSRVSTNSQATDSNYGLDSQELVCENYLKNIHKFTNDIIDSHVNYYCDVGSSYSNPKALHQLNLMIKEIKNSSLILISEISRLGRNVHQVINMLKSLEKKNCWIISISEGLCFNKSKLMNKQFYQKIIDAEKESDLISMRTTNAYNLIRKNGGYLGLAPFGMKKIKICNVPKLVENKNELDIIKLVVVLYKQFGSYETVANKLNENNIKKRNTQWTRYSICSIVKKYGGIKTSYEEVNSMFSDLQI